MMRGPDLSVYLVLDTAVCGQADPVGTAVAAVQNGVGIVQLRAKAECTEDRIALGRRIIAAIRPLGATFVMNDDVAAAVTIGADGAHIGQSDMPVAQARAMIGPDKLLGLSVETVAQAGLVDPTHVDHVGIGPIRSTATKADAAAPLGFAELAEAVARCPVPAVAIGGVTADDAAAIARAGGVGLAVVSAICGQPDPAAATRSLVAAARHAGLRHEMEAL